MIKLATVFSGIGAVEHALNRMDIDFKIIFACDNGDIDVLSKKVNVNMDQINIELKHLESKIKDVHFSHDDSYENQIISMFDLAKLEYEDIKTIIDASLVFDYDNIIRNMLNSILNSHNLKNYKLNQYTQLLNSLESSCSTTQKKLILFNTIFRFINDFKKDNNLKDLGKKNIEFSSSFNINWSYFNNSLKLLYDFFEKEECNNIIRRVKNLSQNVGQLYGKINSLYQLNKLKNIKSYRNKKKFIDNLYRGNERRNKVKISYMENYDCSNEHFHWDARFLDGKQYCNQVDLFVGGSPCQSFSIMGKEKGLNDTRGTLFYEYARLINEIKPKTFIYENVRAVLTNDCGETWKKMKSVFEQLGYKIFFTNNGKPSVLNSKDYGIPQNRQRLFVVGFRDDLKLEKDFEFPKPIPLIKTMQDFLLENLPNGCFLPKKDITDLDVYNFNKSSDIQCLEKYFLSDKIKKTILSTGTKKFYSEPETDLKIARPLVSTMHKMHRACQDNYVTTNGKLRRLTPRECLRLMGFSDNWKIVVSDTSIYKQAGNSIVVDILIHIIDEIIKCYPSLIE